MTDGSGSIVCGVDGSSASLVAASVAREFATTLGRRLVLANAVRTPEPLPFGGTWMRDAQAARAACDGRAMLAHIAPEATHRVALADPAQYLGVVERSERAELLVIGTHRGDAQSSPALVDELLRSAQCPVALVPPAVVGPVIRSGAVVCGQDGAADPEALTVVAKRLGLATRSVFVAPARGWYDAPAPSVKVLRGDPVEELARCAHPRDVRMVVVDADAWSSRSATALAHAAEVLVMLVPQQAMHERFPAAA